MTVVPKFFGVVNERGQLHVDERKDLDRWLRTLKGAIVEIVIKKKPTKRSLDQNALIHVIASAVGEHLGYTIPEMKLLMMGECWGWKKDERTGRDIPIKVSTSEMTRDEATHFLDWALQWAAEQGVYLPSLDRMVA